MNKRIKNKKKNIQEVHHIFQPVYIEDNLN
jgi:hypothetical protein